MLDPSKNEQNPDQKEDEVTFTGEETDRFVRFARKMKSLGYIPYVRVVGREPITSTDVTLEGFVQSSVFDGYIRYITIETNDGKVYNVAGSNATQSIASATVTFKGLPSELAPRRLSSKELNAFLDDLKETRKAPAPILAAIKNGLKFLSDGERSKVVEAVKDRPSNLSVDVRREIVDVLASIGTPEAVNLLLAMSNDADHTVRTDIALRIRGLEKTIKSAGSELTEKTIEVLVNYLKDESRDVRIYSAEDLGYIYNQNAVSALIDTLYKEPDDHVRWAVVIALGRINDHRVIPHLVRKIHDDSFDRVRQSALLGISRLGKTAYEVTTEVLPTVVRALDEGSDLVRGYAAYALGQMGEPATKYMNKLFTALSEEKVVNVKSNSALALSKMLEWIGEAERTTIHAALGKALDSIRDEDRTSPYYHWFLEYSAELLSALEDHGLASKYYRKLCDVSTSWRGPYYAGLSEYEMAEYLCEQSDLETALQHLDKADAHLRNCKGYPSDAHEGIIFRTLMVNARKNILLGVLEWNRAIAEEYDSTKAKFRAAYKIYSQFSMPREPQESESKHLTERELNFIVALRYLSWFAEQLVDMQGAIQAGDESRARTLLATMDVDIDQLLDKLSSTSTPYLRNLAYRIHSEVQTMISKLKTDSRDSISKARIFREGIDAVKKVYQTNSFPLPARMCPIVGLGSAKIVTRITGASGGDGTKASSPRFFPCDAKLVVVADVIVQKRTRSGDRLVFLYRDRSGQMVETDVIVFEGSFPITIDYGVVPKSFEPLPYYMCLKFIGPDCEQTVHEKTEWIQTYDTQQEFLFPQVRELDATEVEERFVNIAVLQIHHVNDLQNPIDYLSHYYDEDLLERGVLVFKRNRYNEIRDQLFDVLSRLKKDSPNVHLVILPELSIPYALFDDLDRYAKDNGCYVFAGFEHKRDPITHLWANQVHIFSPRKDGWVQEKNIPASVTVSGKHFYENIVASPRPRIIKKGLTRLGQIVIVICSEAIGGPNSAELIASLEKVARPDIIVLPSMSPVVEDFYAWAEVNVRRLYSTVVYSNHGQFGYSTIMTPRKDVLKAVQEAKATIDLKSQLHGSAVRQSVVPPMSSGYIVRTVDVIKTRHLRETKASDRDYIQPIQS